MKYPGIEAYVASIDRSGFSGRKVMLSWNIHPTTKDVLLKHNFEVVDIDPWPTDHFFHARMRLAWEYLEGHYQEFRYVFWLDIKDLIVQTNPSVWMEKNIGDSKIVASTECVTIEQEGTNQLWAKDVLGEEKYQEIKNEEVINGGTWAGESEVLKEVFHEVHRGCKDYAGQYPPCQIWINYVMRQEPFLSMLKIPRWSEGFAACLHPVWWLGVRPNLHSLLRDKYPVIDPEKVILYPGVKSDPLRDSIKFCREWRRSSTFSIVPVGKGIPAGVECVIPPENQPFSIVHGYDRDWGMKELFDCKYSFDQDYNWERYKEQKKNNTRPEFKRLRRPNYEGAVSNNKLPQSGRVFKRC